MNVHSRIGFVVELSTGTHFGIPTGLMRPFPEPALLPLRLVSLIWGLLPLAAICAIARRLGGRLLVLLSVLLVAVSLPLSSSANLARWDVTQAALGSSAVGLRVNNKSSCLWASLLSGFCIGLAMEIHPFGMVYDLAIVALYSLEPRWCALRIGHFWGSVWTWTPSGSDSPVGDFLDTFLLRLLVIYHSFATLADSSALKVDPFLKS